jgi:hypothetical protein
MSEEKTLLVQKDATEKPRGILTTPSWIDANVFGIVCFWLYMGACFQGCAAGTDWTNLLNFLSFTAIALMLYNGKECRDALRARITKLEVQIENLKCSQETPPAPTET